MKLRAQNVTNTAFPCLPNKAFVLNKLLKKHWGVNLRYFTCFIACLFMNAPITSHISWTKFE